MVLKKENSDFHSSMFSSDVCYCIGEIYAKSLFVTAQGINHKHGRVPLA